MRASKLTAVTHVLIVTSYLLAMVGTRGATRAAAHVRMNSDSYCTRLCAARAPLRAPSLATLSISVRFEKTYRTS